MDFTLLFTIKVCVVVWLPLTYLKLHMITVITALYPVNNSINECHEKQKLFVQ